MQKNKGIFLTIGISLLIIATAHRATAVSCAANHSQAADPDNQATLQESHFRAIAGPTQNGTQENHVPVVQLLYPDNGTIVAGEIIVNWSASDADNDTLYFDLSIMPIPNGNWLLLAYNTTDYEFLFDTRDVPDWYYWLRIEAKDLKGGVGSDRTDSYFVIDNAGGTPANSEPVVNITSPNGGETVSGYLHVTWEAFHPDNSTMDFELLISSNAGAGWTTVIADLTETTYVINTNSLVDGDRYTLRVVVTDSEGLSSHDECDALFTVQNGNSGNQADSDTDGNIISFDAIFLSFGIVSVTAFSRTRSKNQV